jgi:F-type H+-transporting ATPase subunit delta|tara:strand:+ start:755 stop:1354 length:600 start_codon:yes stop_codon:yes gene_type:complete
VIENADALAKVYARSLFELAMDAGGTEKLMEIADELEQICELAREDKKINLFLSSPVVDSKARGEALSAILTNRITDLTLRFLLVLNNKGRLDRLESIKTAYDQLVQEAFGRVEVDVITPVPIDAESLAMIKGKISTVLGKEPVLHPYVDKKILGGIKLRIGDQLIDGSVQTRLRKLSENLKNNGGAAVRERFEAYMDN